MLHYVVFTDLDGTLLDSETYSYEKSLAMINRLKESGTPLIFCSAKTIVEQEVYRNELGLFHPFIVENGSTIFTPQAYFPFPFAQVNIGENISVKNNEGIVQEPFGIFHCSCRSHGKVFCRVS
jgi:predicted mannosyl-3-phosphoglycerate phosphatase (HAD superfamily)